VTLVYTPENDDPATIAVVAENGAVRKLVPVDGAETGGGLIAYSDGGAVSVTEGNTGVATTITVSAPAEGAYLFLWYAHLTCANVSEVDAGSAQAAIELQKDAAPLVPQVRTAAGVDFPIPAETDSIHPAAFSAIVNVLDTDPHTWSVVLDAVVGTVSTFRSQLSMLRVGPVTTPQGPV